MTSHLRDPELDRLVDELNRRAGPPGDDAAPAEGGGEADGPPGAPAVAEDTGAGPGAPLAAAGDRLLTLDGRPLAEGGTPARQGSQAAQQALATGRPVAGLSEPPSRAGVEAGEALGALLAQAIHRGASDLLLLAGLPPVFRVDGRLRRGDSEPLDAEDVARLFQAQLAGNTRREIDERGCADFSLRLPAGGVGRRADGDPSPALDAGTAASWRFRVNLHRQRGQLAAALRALPREIPTLGSLNLPPSFAELVKPSRGLVLVSGPTGSGKSSTLAALIGEINRGRTAHVITIEDPVEYEHRSNRSLVEHVEIGRDARSFSEALRAALRQDPDVILVGEMRDLETMATAISAAETGHLVLATLHSNDAVQSVHRIVDVFPASQQAQIRHQLALSVHAVVAQQLVPRADGRGRIPAVELMLATFPVRHHIRSDKLEKLYNEITLGKRQGMTSFEESLAQLVREGKIDLDEARVRASHPEELDARLRG
jgi:twitching motility protein PilT